MRISCAALILLLAATGGALAQVGTPTINFNPAADDIFLLGLSAGVGMTVANIIYRNFIAHFFGDDGESSQIVLAAPTYKYRLIINRPAGVKSDCTSIERTVKLPYELREGMELLLDADSTVFGRVNRLEWHLDIDEDDEDSAHIIASIYPLNKEEHFKKMEESGDWETGQN
jgi:hypothetical protein